MVVVEDTQQGGGVPQQRSGRSKPLARMDVPGGQLMFYGDNRFTAVCDNALHGSCVLTRYGTIRSRMKGRPCAMMSAWLAAGPIAEDRQAHWAMVKELEGDFEARSASRASLVAMAGGPAFLANERSSSDGCDKEPPNP